MPETKADLPTSAVETMPALTVTETPARPKPELRPELREIVERNWKRHEEALRYLGR